jgi:hypothetical protein
MPTHQLVLSNNFYNSLIKKRIVMLQKSKSKKINQLKYVLVIPILSIFLMSFNTKTIYIEKDESILKPPYLDNIIINEPIKHTIPEAEIKPKLKEKAALLNKEPIKQIKKTTQKPIKKISPFNNDLTVAVINKESTEADFKKTIAQLKEQGVTVKFKSVKRNAKGEIKAIKIEARSEDSNASFNLNSDEAISPIKISFNQKSGNISIGNVSSKHTSISHVCSDKNDKCAHGNNFVFVSDDADFEFDVETDSNVTVAHAKGGSNHILKNKTHAVSNDDDDDIIIVKSHSKSPKSGANSKAYKIRTIAKDDKQSKIVISTDDDNNDPLIFIDGKKTKKGIMDNIEPDTIESVNVLKGESAIKKYGEKAKDGVIEITTKK